jgi:hypothetical protein
MHILSPSLKRTYPTKSLSKNLLCRTGAGVMSGAWLAGEPCAALMRPIAMATDRISRILTKMLNARLDVADSGAACRRHHFAYLYRQSLRHKRLCFAKIALVDWTDAVRAESRAKS